jgi:TusA-related sulfurtransferase
VEGIEDAPMVEDADMGARPAPVRTLDTSGTLCPFPIVETARALKVLAPGDVLCVVATDPGIQSDMPMWCKATRNEHLGTFKDGGAFRSYVRKRR